ncbi:MAG: hypothetical protein OXI87_18445 [Albidovulum sp.]|nr:hypothetical protein [Albidovulum sp.]
MSNVAVRSGFAYRTASGVAFFAEEVTYELEVWKHLGGDRLVAKMLPWLAYCSGPAPACSTAFSGQNSDPGIKGASTRQTKIRRLYGRLLDPAGFGGTCYNSSES